MKTEEKLFETLEDHELWTLLSQRGWRENVTALPKAQRQRLLVLLETAREPLIGKRERGTRGDDRLVDIGEAARMIGFSRKWLYRNARRLPFTKVMDINRGRGQALRFSANGIQDWLQQLPTSN